MTRPTQQVEKTLDIKTQNPQMTKQIRVLLDGDSGSF